MPSGIEEHLDLAHDVVELVAVLTAHEGCHHATGAVLGLQGATHAQDQVHHVLGELAVAVQLFLRMEAVGEHEVDVAVLGVAEDDAVAVAVLVEELDQLDAGAAERGHRHDDVLEQRSGALPAGPSHGGVEPLAQVPQLGAGRGVGAEARWCAER